MSATPDEPRIDYRWIAVYPVIHFGAIWLGLELSASNYTSTLWVSNALLVGILASRSYRDWPILLGAALFAEVVSLFTLSSHLPVFSAAWFSVANLCEVLFGAWLWKRLGGGRPSMGRLRDTIALALVVATLAPAVSSLMAAATFVGFGDFREFAHFWQLWWASEALGLLIVAPVVLSWLEYARERFDAYGQRRFELGIVAVLSMLLAIWIFSQEPTDSKTLLNLPYATYPFLIWGVLRFGYRESALLVLMNALVATYFTNQGLGPFSLPGYSVYESVLALQLFMVAIAVSVMVVAASFNEHRLAQDRIRRQAEERMELEQQLQQSKKMESIGNLAGGVAHDFNNILTSIMGYTDLALGELSGRRDSTMRSYLEGINDASSRARELVGHLMTFGRRRKAEKVRVEIGEIVDQVVSLLKPALPPGLTVEIHLDRDVIAVMGDPVQLQQAIMNLCINARDAMDGHGTVHIEARRQRKDVVVCSSCRKVFSGDFASIQVRDTGAGLPVDQVDSLFEPFYTTKAPGVGSGLGLSVVHGAVHSHGGHVTVTSQPGDTCFSIFLPIAGVTPRQPEVVGASQPAPENLRGRVLLVDDEPIVANAVSMVLQKKGLEVEIATDPNAALDRFSGQPHAYDIVVTDQIMPAMVGTELARQLSRIRPGIPIILCSGFSRGVDESRLASVGIGAFLPKPVDFDALATRIASLLSSQPGPSDGSFEAFETGKPIDTDSP